MTPQQLLLHPAVQSLGRALLHFLWQGALLAAIFLIATSPIQQARVKYAIGCIAMLLMPAIFIATIFTIHPAATASQSRHDRVSMAIDISNSEPKIVQVNSTAPPPPADTKLPGLLVCIWLTGIVALSLSTSIGYFRVQRLTRSHLAPVPEPCLQALQTLIERLKISRPIRLCVSTIAEVPAVIGWLRPCILLPLSALTGLTDSQLQGIIAHELAHIRRHDYLVNLLQTAVETLFFFHPAVWWIGRRVRQEREHCCDDLAVSTCGDPVVYAHALTRLEELRGNISQAALAATGGDLLTRIQRLLPHPNEKRTRPLGATIALALALIAAAAANLAPAIHAAELPRFEAASIKPTDPAAMHNVGVHLYPGGRVIVTAETLKILVMIAFHMSYWQVSGGEAWIGKDNYDIEAMPPENLRDGIKDLRHTWFAIEDEQLRAMVQALLIDRFHLKVHRETRIGDVYLLERSGKPIPLKPTEPAVSEAGTGSMGYAAGHWAIGDLSLPQIAKFASDFYLHAPVLDRTGLKGAFDYRQTSVDEQPDYADPTSSFLRFIPELGLKLERTKGPVETLVIDEATKPIPN